MKRHPVNKTKSARKFRSSAMKTKAINRTPRPTRGGGRL